MYTFIACLKKKKKKSLNLSRVKRKECVNVPFEESVHELEQICVNASRCSHSPNTGFKGLKKGEKTGLSFTPRACRSLRHE